MSSNFSFPKREREDFILSELDRLYEIGRFRKEIITLNKPNLNSTLNLYLERMDSWHGSQWTSSDENRRADRHKVGANTAIAIVEWLPLDTLTSDNLNPYESIANSYFAYKLAVARIFSDHKDKIDLFDFPERDIKMVLSLFIKKEWTAKTLSLELYRMEECYLLKYKEHVSPSNSF
ncbi:hypothetical protein [Leptospira interrogans]|uniref:hypothetical protein n=1 Tax=Leptospira interrogans TaxID=173 RepID=UPI0007732A3F|nr:hypothetical protein [Leptospira interrogans]